jgi:putative ABC transport system permease protein
MRTPLAWKNLTSSGSKCLLAASGVGFAVVLMFMQIGFRNALIDSNVQLFSLFDIEQANVVVVSRARFSVSTEQRFSRIVLDKIASLPEVQSVGVIQIERGTARIQIDRRPVRPIRIIAVDSTAEQFFLDRQLASDFRSADSLNACLVDRESKSFYEFASSPQQLSQQSMELNGKSLQAVGFFHLGTDFANDGSLLMSDRLHAQYFPWRWKTRRSGDSIDLALLSVKSATGQTLGELVEKIQALAPNQIQVTTTRGYMDREKTFWKQATPIGKIFFIGTLMGLIVGAIICYQIQFTDISDHMAEFATLKAMGYSTGYFWIFILSQSIYLACLGFLPGLLVSFSLYELLARSSGLIMRMTLGRMALVWLLTVLMCIVSGALAIRKLFRSDPASLF